MDPDNIFDDESSCEDRNIYKAIYGAWDDDNSTINSVDSSIDDNMRTSTTFYHETQETSMETTECPIEQLPSDFGITDCDQFCYEEYKAVPSYTEALLQTQEMQVNRKDWLPKFGKTFEELRPNFAWLPLDRVRATINATTQLYRSFDWGNKMKRHFMSRFPGANVRRTHETVSSDSMWWDGPAADDDGITGHAGAIGVQVFAGTTSRHLFGVPIRTDGEFENCMKEYIRKVGAPDKMWSDQAKAMTAAESIKALYRMYNIDDGHSEPYYKNQNKVERHIQDIKRLTVSVMNATGTPNGRWLLCVLFIIGLLNHVATPVLNDRTPMELKFGETPDVSKYLCFRWWEPVYYLDQHGKEHLGRWAGIADNVGDELTWIIVSGETGKAMFRSDVRTATDPKRPNLRAEAILDAPSGEKEDRTAHDDIFSPDEPWDEATKTNKYTPDELVGKFFLKEDPETGNMLRTKIIRQLEYDKSARKKQLRYLVQADNGTTTVEDIMEYNELCDLVEKQLDAMNGNPEEQLWSFQRILAHKGPLKPDDNEYKGCPWLLLIDWDGHDATWEPRNIIEESDPMTVATYAKENNLLNVSGWKKYKNMGRKIRKVNRIVRSVMKAKKNHPSGPQYNYGVRLPDRKMPFNKLDEANGNKLWQEAHEHEIDCFDDYKVYIDKGKATNEKLRQLHKKGYQLIPMLWVYAVKHDGRRRARLVAGGHRTSIDEGVSSYSSVVNLRTLRMVLLLGELNGLKIMTADIVSAYFMAYTNEKVFFIAGPEFGDREGHIMIFDKACYGLKTSGKRYHDKTYDTMAELGFRPSLADPDIYMRDAGDCYEYVAVYVDDLTLIMKDPVSFLDALKNKGFMLKDVTDSPEVFLGGSVSRDQDGTLAWGAKKYIVRSLDNLERMLGEKPAKNNVPIPENTHPEIDTSPLLDEDGVALYQTMIGMLQWTVTLGRFDIACAVMTMSRFRTAPREGHLHLLKHVFGYLRKYTDGAIRFRTDIPNHEASFQHIPREWEKMVYGDVKEELPYNMPEPKGKTVRLSGWFDANLYHCLVTGRSALLS